MSIIPLTVEIAAVCCVAAILLHRYGNWKAQHLLVTLATFIAWYFSFMIIFTLPIDVSNTCYRQCLTDHMVTTPAPPTTSEPNSTSDIDIFDVSTQSILTSTQSANVSTSPNPFNDKCKTPLSYVSSKVLLTFWHVVYWTSQVLTWLILPIMQSYATAGDFTVAGKIKTSLIENAIYYGSYLIIFGVLLIYLVIRPDINIDGPTLKVLGITASNTWGLFLLVLLLGYGLVEVPRGIWNSSKRGHMLNYTYFKLAKLSVEKTEAEENLEDVLDDVKKAAETIRYNHPMRKCVDTILEKCPESVKNNIRRTTREDYQDFNNPTETPTEKSLVRLHKNVIKAMQAYRRTQCQWDNMLEKAYNYEDIASNEKNSNHCFVRSGPRQKLTGKFHSPKLEWYWKCWMKPMGLKLLAIILIIFSAVVVWSECLFFVSSPVLSIFALFIELAKNNYDYVSIEFVCFITIAYLSWCAYSTVFKVRVFNYYYLASHHMTDEYSLIFCGMMLCRLTPPLCLNFLGLIHMDTHVTQQENIVETYYTQIMGHMDVIRFISDGFNIYFPILIVLLCVATFFRLGSRVLHCLGFQQFIGDDDMTAELTDEGKNLVQRERRKLERAESSAERRRDWNERFMNRRRDNVENSTNSDVESAASAAGAALANAGRKRASEYGSRGRTHGSALARSASGREMAVPGQGGYQNREVGGSNRAAAGEANIETLPVFSIVPGRYTAPRSPQEHDTAGLLKEVEPLDYTNYTVNNADPFLEDGDGAPRYQGRGGPASRPSRPTTLNTSSRGSGSHQPPKGIFDDI